MFRAGGFFTQCFASPFDNIEDSAGRLGPSEGFGRVQVMGLNESADLVSQFAHDQVQRQVGRRRALDLHEELAELGGAMATGDRSENLPGRDIEGRVQIRGPVPLVVVGAARDLPGLQWEHGMGPVEGLDLRLLVDREHQPLSGGFR